MNLNLSALVAESDTSNDKRIYLSRGMQYSLQFLHLLQDSFDGSFDVTASAWTIEKDDGLYFINESNQRVVRVGCHPINGQVRMVMGSDLDFEYPSGACKRNLLEPWLFKEDMLPQMVALAQNWLKGKTDPEKKTMVVDGVAYSLTIEEYDSLHRLIYDGKITLAAELWEAKFGSPISKTFLRLQHQSLRQEA